MAASPHLCRQAFTVFCDHTLQDATERNARLRVANDAMGKAWGMMTKIKCYRYHYEGGVGSKTKTLTLQNTIDLCDDTPDREDDTHLVYTLANNNSHAVSLLRSSGDDGGHENGGADDGNAADNENMGSPILFEKFRAQHFSVSGYMVPDELNTPMNVYRRPLSQVAEFIMDDEDETITVKAVAVMDLITITGPLTNYAGTYHEVKQMIHDNRIYRVYSRLGVVNTRTGMSMNQGARSSAPLADAIITPTEVSITKSTLRATLDLVAEWAKDDADVDDEVVPTYLAHLATLSDIVPSNQGLAQAIRTGKALARRNRTLKACCDLVGSVEIYAEDGTQCLFRRHLDQGDVVHMPSGELVWRIDIDYDDSVLVPLTAVPSLVAKVGHSQGCVEPDQHVWAFQWAPFQVRDLIVKFRNGMLVSFRPELEILRQFFTHVNDHSGATRLDLADMLYRGSFRHTLVTPSIPHRVQQILEASGLIHASMRIFRIQIPLNLIQETLDVLASIHSS